MAPQDSFGSHVAKSNLASEPIPRRDDDLVSIFDMIHFLNKWKVVIVLLTGLGLVVGLLKSTPSYQSNVVLETSRKNRLVMIDPIKINHAIADGLTQESLTTIFATKLFAYLGEDAQKTGSGAVTKDALAFLRSHFHHSGSSAEPSEATEEQSLAQYLQTHYSKEPGTDLKGSFVFDIRYSADSPIYKLGLRLPQGHISKPLAKASNLAFSDFVKAYNEKAMQQANQKRDAKEALLRTEVQGLKDRFTSVQMHFEKEIAQQKMEFYTFESKLNQMAKASKGDVMADNAIEIKDRDLRIDTEKNIDILEQRHLIRQIVKLESAKIINADKAQVLLKELNGLLVAKRDPELRYRIELQRYQIAHDDVSRSLAEVMRPVDSSDFALPEVEISSDAYLQGGSQFDMVALQKWVWAFGGSIVGFFLSLFCAFVFATAIEVKNRLAGTKENKLEQLAGNN